MPKKQIKKTIKKDVGFELHRLVVLVEQSNDKWDLVAEQYGNATAKLDGVVETVEKLATDLAIVKEDVEFIKGGLKRKADYDELMALERRVMLLEKK